MEQRNTNSITERILTDVVDDLIPITRRIDVLFDLGYAHRFELLGSTLLCEDLNDVFPIRDLMVDYIHHVPGIGYVYGIRHRDQNIKGIFACYTDKIITIK